MDVRRLLEQVKSGEMDLSTAEEFLKKLPYEDLGYAKLDHHRKLRSGYGEVVYCAGKAETHLVGIYNAFAKDGLAVMGTRATEEQYKAVRQAVPNVVYDPLSKILKLEQPSPPKETVGRVAICTGGTSDIGVAEEAAQTAEFMGSEVVRVYDVGVAGIHRLLSRLDEIRSADCIVAVAGMEGALAGVLAGLVDKPVIALPTSVGYGASFHGLAALLTMLNSCAEGIAVVNIDNGFGAGYMASQIAFFCGKRNLCKENEFGSAD